MDRLLGLIGDFPIFKREIDGRRVVYLDSASTSQKPRQVIDAVSRFYECHNANVHRGVYRLSEEATEMYEEAHKKAEGFINAGSGEVVFTKNTTESLNLLAYSLGSSLGEGDEVLVSEMEHHSNIVPWQQVAKVRGFRLRFARVTRSGLLDMDNLLSSISRRTKIVSVCHVSNVLGTVNEVRGIARIAHDNGALLVVDGAQSVPHMPMDVKSLGCDFLAFSSHKMLGPAGIGVLYGRRDLLEGMSPLLYGGGMIREVGFKDSTFAESPWKFEAGTCDVAGAVGFGAAIDYLRSIGMEDVFAHDVKLTKYAFKSLSERSDVAIYGPDDRLSVVSFNLSGVHPHDVAQVLDGLGIAVRGGHHCAMPLMSRLGIDGSVRASLYIYNSKDDVDLLASALDEVRKVFHG